MFPIYRSHLVQISLLNAVMSNLNFYACLKYFYKILAEIQTFKRKVAFLEEAKKWKKWRLNEVVCKLHAIGVDKQSKVKCFFQICGLYMFKDYTVHRSNKLGPQPQGITMHYESKRIHLLRYKHASFNDTATSTSLDLFGICLSPLNESEEHL